MLTEYIDNPAYDMANSYVIGDRETDAHIDYKSKTCTLTETRYGKPVDLLEKGSQSTNMNNY